MKVSNTYLFTAFYADGTEYVQGIDDESVQDPSRNAFYDISVKPLKGNLIGFSLSAIEPIEGHPAVVGVDLRNGEFNIDGVSVFLHHAGEAFRDRKLFFARDVQQHRELSVSEGGVVPVKDYCSVNYLIGWSSAGVDRFIKV